MPDNPPPIPFQSSRLVQIGQLKYEATVNQQRIATLEREARTSNELLERYHSALEFYANATDFTLESDGGSVAKYALNPGDD